MWLSVIFVWGSLLLLVVSQNCLDPAENSASWVRLKPLGQCRDGESMCPYRITLPPLAVQLPKPFRELEKMARELQSLTKMVNQLQEDCRVCKERHGMEWNQRGDDEGKDEERIQASRGTLNTKERQQDVSKREGNFQVTSSRPSAEVTKNISGDVKDVNPASLEKQRNINQVKNANPRITKPRAEIHEGSKGVNPSRKNLIGRNIIKDAAVPSPKTTKEKSPMAKLPESPFPGDLNSEQPTQHEKHQPYTIKDGNKMYLSETLTAKGKVKSISEYDSVTIDTNDDYSETEKLQTPKGDKRIEETQLVTSSDAENKGVQPNMKQHTSISQDKKEFADTILEESRSNIMNDTDSEIKATVIQHSTIKNTEKKEINIHLSNFTETKTVKPGSYSERTAEADEIIRGPKQLTSPITGRANASDNASQINPHSLEIRSKNAFKPDNDSKMDIRTESKFNTTERVSGQGTSRSTLSGITNGIVDVSPTNQQIRYGKKQLNAGTDSENNAGMNLYNVKHVGTVNGSKNSSSSNSGRDNSTGDVDIINKKIVIGKFQTQFNPGTDAESNIKMDSNPIAGTTDGIVDVSPTNPQIPYSISHFNVDRDPERDVEKDLNPINKTETVRLPISDKVNARADLKPIQLSSNSQTLGGQDTPRSSIPGITDGMVDVRPSNPQFLRSKNQVKYSTDSGSETIVGSNPANNINTVREQDTSRSPISGIPDNIADEKPINLQIIESKKQFRIDTNSDSYAVMDPNPVNIVDILSQIHQMPQSAKRPFEPETDQDRKTEMNSTNKVKIISSVEMPQLSIPGTADVTVNVNQTDSQTVYSNTENDTVISTPVRKVETETQRPSTSISKKQLKDDTTEMYSNQDRQGETSESPMSDFRLDARGTNLSLNSKDDIPKKRFVPKTKLNMTQPRNGWIKSPDPMSVGSERKKPLRNNKLIPLTNDGIKSSRNLTELLPLRLEKQQEITNQSERMSLIKRGPSDNPRHRKPYNLQKIPENKGKAFESGTLTNITGVIIYTANNGTTNADSTTVHNPDNDLNSTSQSVKSTLATHNIVNKSHINRAKPSPTDDILHTGVNHQSPNTSTDNKPGLEYPGRGSVQDMMLDTVYNFGRDSQTRVVEEIEGTDGRTRQSPQVTSTLITTPDYMDLDYSEQARTTSAVKVSNKHVHRRPENPRKEMKPKISDSDSKEKEFQGVTFPRDNQSLDIINNIERDSLSPVVEETGVADRRTRLSPFKTARVDSHKGSNKKPFREGSSPSSDGMMNIVGISRERFEFNNPVTSEMPQDTSSVKPTLHFMDQDHAGQAKTTYGVKVSNLHYSLENPSQVMDPKISRSDTRKNEFQRVPMPGRDVILDTATNIERKPQHPVMKESVNSEQDKTSSRVVNKRLRQRLERPNQESEVEKSHSDSGHKAFQRENNGQMPSVVTNSLNIIQNITTGSMSSIMDIVKSNASSKPSTTLLAQSIVDQSHINRAKPAPTGSVLHRMINHQTENPSLSNVTKRPEKPEENSEPVLISETVNTIGRNAQPPVVEKTEGTDRRTGQSPFSNVDSNRDKDKITQVNFSVRTPDFMEQDHVEPATSGLKVSNVHHRLENPSQEMKPKLSHSDIGNKNVQSEINGQGSTVVSNNPVNSLNSAKNRAVGSMAIIMDIDKSNTKLSTPSTESTSKNSERDSNTVAIDNAEASTEANWVSQSTDNEKNHRSSNSPLVSNVHGNNGAHSTNNKGNSYTAAVNRINGTTLNKITAGHTIHRHNKKQHRVNDMEDRQGLKKQLLNCHGQCPTRHEQSNNDREKPAQDCSDFLIRSSTSGIYNVTPTGSGNITFPVFCDMESSGGGWTLIQHRFNGSVHFNRTWDEYKKGFGNLTGEFWLGNDKIHWLTLTKPMLLRIELEDLDGIKEYAQYNHFHVANESQYYRLMIEGYSGTAGDAMQYSKRFNHNQKNFTTPDRDNDQYTSGNCGAYYSSGWWFDACMAANLNGKYYGTRYRGIRNGIFWGTWHNISTESYLTQERQSFKTVRMMIRPRTELLMD